MENENSRPSSEDSIEDISNSEMAQNMDLGEKLCLKPEDGISQIGLANKNRKASSSGLSRMDNQLKPVALQAKDGTTDRFFSSENLQSSEDFPLSTHELKETDEKAEKIERNLEKFLEREPLREVQLRKKTGISRQVRSDGEMAKIIQYYGDVLKVSTCLSNSKRSSAPPTLNNESEPEQISRTYKAFCNESSNKIAFSKEISENADACKKVDRTGNSSTKALDQRLSKISTFKVPISPNQKATPDKSTKIVSTGTKADVVTPAQRRPTHFDVRQRKTFYMFSPGSSSGVLRQCQSLPDMNRPRRKDEAQRRSINFGEHSRIIRSLFRDNPEPATPESKVSFFNKNYNLMKAPESSERASEIEPPKTMQNRSSKICRKLDFGSSSKELADRSQISVADKEFCDADVPKSVPPDNIPLMGVPKILPDRPSKTCRRLVFVPSSKEKTDKSQQAGESCDEESKRKNASPITAGYFISSKKVRTSSESKVTESETGENIRKDISSDDKECSISAKRASASSETKIEEDSSNENVLPVDVGSISKKVKTSSGTQMEGSSENVRKNATPIDVECSISAKKVKTSSEINIEENESMKM